MSTDIYAFAEVLIGHDWHVFDVEAKTLFEDESNAHFMGVPECLGDLNMFKRGPIVSVLINPYDTRGFYGHSITGIQRGKPTDYSPALDWHELYVSNEVNYFTLNEALKFDWRFMAKQCDGLREIWLHIEAHLKQLEVAVVEAGYEPHKCRIMVVY